MRTAKFGSAIEGDEQTRKDLVERLVESEEFRDSPVQQGLLRFLASQAGDPSASGIKEYAIGTDYFHRGPDFDPRMDSIVRTQVSLLRRRLTRYYQGTGKNDPLIVEIPRGHYQVRFLAQKAADAIAPGSPLPVKPRYQSWHWPILAGGIMLGAMLVLAFENTPRREWNGDPFWGDFFASDQPVLLAFGIPTFFRAGPQFVIRDVEVNGDRVNSIPSPLPSLGDHLHLTRAEIYTGIGEAVGMHELSHFFWQAGRKVEVLRHTPRRWSDLAKGNVVLISSLRFSTFENDSSLPVDFTLDSSGGTALVRNLRPRTGEPAHYLPQLGADGSSDGVDYAVITRRPGAINANRVVTLGGTYRWGTHGAAEYLTDFNSLSALAKELRKRPATNPADTLQVVLRVEARDNVPFRIQYITHHWLRPGQAN